METDSRSYVEPGIYFIQVSSPASTSWGESTEYDLHIFVSVGGSTLRVCAQDALNLGHSPSGAEAHVKGPITNSQPFNLGINVDFF